MSWKEHKIFTSEWWTEKLSLIIRNEDNLEEKRRISYTPAHLVFFSFTAFVLIFILGFFSATWVFSRGTPLMTQSQKMQELIRINEMLDSLNQNTETNNKFTENLQKVLREDVDYIRDEEKKIKKTSGEKEKDSNQVKVNIDQLDKAELSLREEIENGQSKFARFTGGSALKLRDLFLFSPIATGIVSEKYNVTNAHYGVDIVAKKDEPIKAVSEGTVIMASWTDETGYVIAIQHKSDLISVYKHCSRLEKKAGEFVKTGEVIAIIGNTGELTTGPHLHFELWYKGNPMNPEDLILF